MSIETCPTSFDETLVSGHLDGELTQAAEQRVRLHLEDCTSCRALLEELRTLREATMSTEFSKPDDTQWDEQPRGAISRVARGAGWIMAILWVAVLAVYGLWQYLQEPANLVERLLIFGGLSAIALLFVSVCLDRMRTARTDPYREVEK